MYRRPWASLRPLSSRRALHLASQECRRRIAEQNARVNAFVCTSPPLAPIQNEGQGSRTLENVPIAVKDSICTKDTPTTCSSEMLREFTSPYDATVVKLLKDAGADIIGKVNCDEFGMGSLNTYSIHGPVVNPRPPPLSPDRSAGGSSGGSAAAVAAGMCYAALGTDTGGSTRLPASYCGVVGLKPSYGLLSRHGLISYADSLDCVGVFGGSVDAAQKVFDVLNAYDAQDPTSSLPENRGLAKEAAKRRLEAIGCPENPLHGLQIGVPQEYFPEELDPSITSAIRSILSGLRSLGAQITPVSLKNTRYALSAYYVLASAEASSCLARYDGVEYGLNERAPPGTTSTAKVYAYSRSQGFGAEVQKRILLGTYALSAELFDNYFLQARRVRQLVKNDFDSVFSIADYRGQLASANDANLEGVDVLLHPSAIQTAPLLEEASKPADGVQTYVQDVLTVPASLAGLPGLSVPTPNRRGESEDTLPIGVSVIGQWGCEDLVFAVGRAIEKLRS